MGLPSAALLSQSILPGLLIGSLGMGAIFMPITLMATTGLKDEDQGLASGLFNTSQQVGGALGLAILSTIAASHTADKNSVADAVHGYHYAFAGAAVFVALSLLVMILLLRKHHVAQIQAEAAEGGAIPVG